MVCQNCGAENLPDSRFCDSCGHALTPPPVAPPPMAPPQAPAPVPPPPSPAQQVVLPPSAPAAVGSGLPPTVPTMPPPPPPAPAPPAYAAPPPAPPASQVYAAACGRCGAALKPGAQFCGSCGQPVVPGAAMGMGTPAPVARPAGGGSGCGKLLGCGCVLLLLLLGLGAGGVVIGSRTLLSSPKAFVGVWKVLDTDKGKATELGSFRAEVAGDGLKVKPAGNADDVIAFEMKRNGVRSFKGRATNPDNKDEWADLTLTMGFWGRRLTVAVEASDGEKETWSAQRDLQATLEAAVKE